MNQLSRMTTGNRSPLESLLKSGKNQHLARMVGSISSVLNHQSKLTDGHDSLALAEKRKKVRAEYRDKYKVKCANLPKMVPKLPLAPHIGLNCPNVLYIIIVQLSFYWRVRSRSTLSTYLNAFYFHWSRLERASFSCENNSVSFGVALYELQCWLDYHATYTS